MSQQIPSTLPARLRLAAVALAAAAGAAAAAPPAAVATFVPGGDARGAAQATLNFSQPMLRFGEPRAAAPAQTDCGPGEGRWLDERTWAYEFAAPLPAGIACAFTLQPKLRTLAGGKVEGAQRFAVVTGAPAVAAIAPRAGSEVDAGQAFLLRLDGALDPGSLEAVACAVDGVAERLPVRLLDAAQREALLAALARQPWDYAALVAPDGEAVGDEPGAGPRDPALERHVVALDCGRDLPAGARLRLAWGPGLRSASGITGATAQQFDYTVRADFTARLECTRVQAKSPCLPLRPLELRWSAPVPAAQALAARLVTPDGRRLAPRAAGTGTAAPVLEGVSFAGPFVPRGRYRLELPAGLVDDAGRPLANAARFPQVVVMDELPPLARFAAGFGVLERHAQPALPVTLRDVEERAPGRAPAVPGRVLTVSDDLAVMDWLKRLERDGYRPEVALLAGVAGARPIAVPRAEAGGVTEVVGIPLPGPGLHVVELASPRLGAKLLERAGTYHVRAGALVTNLAVHFKQGRENALAWVTRLDSGAPVAGAAVTVRDCRGRVLATARSDAAGIARIGTALPEDRARCEGWWRGFFVAARSGDDFAFTLGDWGDGLSPWDFGLESHPDAGDGAAVHAVFDRTLLRAGETVHMKLFLRQRGLGGFGLPARAAWPDRAIVEHASGQRWELPLRFTGGAAVVDFAVPREARLGTYRVRAARGGEDYGQEAGEFRVEDFRLPTLRATLQLPRAPLVAAARAPVDVAVTFLAGGGASGAPVELRTRSEPYAPRFAGYDDYSFAARRLAAGVVRHGEAAEQAAAAAGALVPLKLDAAGGARAELPLPAADLPRRLIVEMEYPDANGERLTTAQSTPLWPAAVAVGLRPARWPRAGKAFAVDAVVLDLDGRPAAGRTVVVEAWSREYFSYRRRLVGGFYAYDGGVETRPLGEVCRATSAADGRVRCQATFRGHDGITLVARATDAAGREALAVDDVWLAGEDAWYGGQDSDRMDLVPERRRYEAGETARLRAELPFRAATALVTVEREGVLDAFVQPLSAREPRVEVPIAARHAPNVFVSVLAVRGRVAEPAPTALVDLGRPSFRMGLVELEVGRRPHELVVEVRPAAEVYAPRGKARAEVRVRRADGGPLPAGAEVAFVAVDEALLELAPNESWSLLEAMTAPRSLAVRTSTALGQVVGRRHYGRKAVPAGGGGGRLPTRELFEPLLAWQARVPLDAEGRASVEVPLNDSLSSFRLVAIAHAGLGHFGTGSARVRTHRDLMLFAGLPEVLREGDTVLATATLRNAGTRPVEAQLAATVAADGGPAQALAAAGAAPLLTLAPGESREVALPLAVPQGARALAVSFVATAGASRDAVTVRPRVLPWPGAPTTWQATLRRLDAPASMPVAPPAGALPGVGGLEVTLAPSLTASLAGVREAMRQYPYSCIEQRTSVAVALGDAAAFARVAATLPAHLADDGLLAYFPGLPRGSAELTAYVVSIAHEAGWTLPAPALERMLEALGPYAAGARTPRAAPAGAALLLRLRALEALARHGKVEPRWLEGLGSTAETWPTTALLDWYSVLRRVPGAADGAARLAAARALLRARMSLTATRLGFAGEDAARLPWLLSSGDLDAVRALGLLADDPAFAADAARLAGGAVGRQQRGAWDTTVANAWGALALERYARLHERAPVAGRTSAALAGARQSHDWAQAAGGGTLALPWGRGRGRLELTHAGSGAPYAVVRSVASVPLRQPVFAGYRVRKTVEPVARARADRWSRGDVLRVRLEIEALADATWVALDDPLPAGAAIVGGGLKRGLEPLPAPPARGAATAWPSFVERRAEAYRAYFEALPRGRWQVEYTVRLNAAGRFLLPATRVESLYEPDRYAALPNAAFEVGAAP